MKAVTFRMMVKCLNGCYACVIQRMSVCGSRRRWSCQERRCRSPAHCPVAVSKQWPRWPRQPASPHFHAAVAHGPHAHGTHGSPEFRARQMLLSGVWVSCEISQARKRLVMAGEYRPPLMRFRACASTGLPSVVPSHHQSRLAASPRGTSLQVQCTTKAAMCQTP